MSVRFAFVLVFCSFFLCIVGRLLIKREMTVNSKRFPPNLVCLLTMFMLLLGLHIIKFIRKFLFMVSGFWVIRRFSPFCDYFGTFMVSNFNVKFSNHLELNVVDSVMSKSTFLFPRYI